MKRIEWFVNNKITSKSLFRSDSISRNDPLELLDTTNLKQINFEDFKVFKVEYQ